MDSDDPPLPPDFPLNCPKCGLRLAYLRSEGDVAIYHCPSDGVVRLPPDGRIKVVVH